MLEHVPEWLGAALHNVRAGHSKLAAVKLGGEGVVGAGGMVLTSAAFENGEELDPSFTADEEDAVAPPQEFPCRGAFARRITKPVLSSTEARWLIGADSRDRTGDLMFTRQLLCHLS